MYRLHFCLIYVVDKVTRISSCDTVSHACPPLGIAALPPIGYRSDSFLRCRFFSFSSSFTITSVIRAGETSF